MQNAYIDGAKLGEESAWIWIIDYLKNNYDLPEDFVKNMAKASGRTFTTEIMKTWTK